jgi:hypothetical protein
MARGRKAICPVYEQTCEAIELLIGNGLFPGAGALDSTWPRAQHHSYTNKLPRGGNTI